MKKSIILSGLSIVVATLLVGCNSDSASSVSDVNIDDTVLKGQFIDSAVANIEYESESGFSGKTDANGTFEYEDGDRVKFHIGKLVLGEATPKKGEPVTPRELTDDNKTLNLMLQLLQSLDSDNNTSNGITIPEDVIESLQQKTETITLEELNKTEILKIDDKLQAKIDEDRDGKIDVDETLANNHLKSSIDESKKEEGKDIDEGNKHSDSNSTNPPENNSNKHGEDNATGDSQDGTKAVVDVFAYEKYELSQDLKDAIAYMGNEERLAYDVYKNLYDIHEANGKEIKQLKNISEKSEIRHIQTVRDVVKKYGITASGLTNLDSTPVGDMTTAIDSVSGKYDIKKIQDLYNALYDKGVTSQKDALEVGCMVEVTDITDLETYINIANKESVKDIEDVFIALKKGSYSHYWAFDKGLKNIGVEDGCCALGKEYCHPEYPNEESNSSTQKGNNGNEDNNTANGNNEYEDGVKDNNETKKDNTKHGSEESNTTKGNEQKGDNSSKKNKENNASKDIQNENNNTKDIDDTTLLESKFIDSAVANLEYESDSGVTGTTDASGTFKYEDGDIVKFHIGKLVLGEVAPKQGEVVTPKELTDNDETLTLMLQVLQSLDSDNDISNGITIPEDVIDSLNKKSSEINLENLTKEELLKIDEKLKTEIDKNGDGKIDVNETSAHEHFKSTLGKLKSKRDSGDDIKEEKRSSDNLNGNHDSDNKGSLEDNKTKNQDGSMSDNHGSEDNNASSKKEKHENDANENNQSKKDSDDLSANHENEDNNVSNEKEERKKDAEEKKDSNGDLNGNHNSDNKGSLEDNKTKNQDGSMSDNHGSEDNNASSKKEKHENDANENNQSKKDNGNLDFSV